VLYANPMKKTYAMNSIYSSVSDVSATLINVQISNTTQVHAIMALAGGKYWIIFEPNIIPMTSHRPNRKPMYKKFPCSCVELNKPIK